MAEIEIRERDVVRYVPRDAHCHEGMAIAHRNPDGTIALFDTYWHSQPRLVCPDTPVDVLFNLDDYEPAERWTWDRHAPADRQVVTHQHGLQRDLYIRKGAVESREQIVENARTELAEAEEKVRSAVFMRDGAQRYLYDLLAKSGGAS